MNALKAGSASVPLVESVGAAVCAGCLEVSVVA